ncbi:hypothetical protein B0H16DRAFT_1859452 [Mycena metata]|uniref:Uncharacterized protein n=1 Tax=Mycena metata TaxID=1033252 RepID=A0AAD7K3K2_9AGAR|nr:hypothetical protein B0H16DRAFT_1859452 [Mycena metata]
MSRPYLSMPSLSLCLPLRHGSSQRALALSTKTTNFLRMPWLTFERVALVKDLPAPCNHGQSFVDLKVLNSRIRHDKVLGVSTVPSPTPGDARTYDLYPRIHSPATPQLFNSLPVKSHRTLRNLDCAPSPHTKPFQEAAWSHQIHSVYPSIFQVVKSVQGLNSENICVFQPFKRIPRVVLAHETSYCRQSSIYDSATTWYSSNISSIYVLYRIHRYHVKCAGSWRSAGTGHTMSLLATERRGQPTVTWPPVAVDMRHTCWLHLAAMCPPNGGVTRAGGSRRKKKRNLAHI